LKPDPTDLAEPGAAPGGLVDRSDGKFSNYQKFVIAVMAFLQFTIVLDFMLLAPLGALVLPALNITTAQFGLVVSAYAFSAGFSGFLAAGFADRFDRKKLLVFFYSGFLAGTLLCGFASGYHWLLFARMVTGVFAGVVGSVSMAIITDLFPMQMRGRVMGVIQMSFGASSVLGLPTALLLSTRWGWNAPFLMLVGVGTLVGGVIQAYLRPVAEHLKHRPDRSPLHHLVKTVSNRLYLQGFVTTGLLSVGGFMLMPFMSVFMVGNLGLPTGDLPLIYMITGIFSLLSGPLIGRASDTLGKFPVFAFGCAMTIAMVVIYTHLGLTPLWELAVVLVFLHIGIFSRMISASALMSALPAPLDRGAYMSISSSLQQVAGGVAAAVGGLIVVQTPAGLLLHFDTLGYVLVCTTLLTLAMMYLIDRRIRGAAATVAISAPQPAVRSGQEA
jgi:predicted MFS family arabinose efflux permease